MVALGTRVYLSCTIHDELVPGHCLIVPIQHHLTMLEGDDDVWDEIRVWAQLSEIRGQHS
jgi:Protein similar to CwfJ C-terminus 1